MEVNKIVSVLTVVAVVVALANVSITLMKVADFNEKITGLASDAGYVNISVETEISVNMSRDTVNWGSGLINGTGEDRFNATLKTAQETATVERGNWSHGSVKGLILQNLGNINASINLTAANDADDLFGSAEGSGSDNQRYRWNMTNKDAGSCSGGSEGLSTWNDVNKSSANFCGQFNYGDNENEVYIDIWLTVPYDAQNTGAQSDTITVTAGTAF
jgi:hypothetical protein